MSRVPVVVVVAALLLSACSADDDEPLSASPYDAGSTGVVDDDEADDDHDDGPQDDDDDDDGPRSPLTGLPVDEDLLDLPLLQVKIENSPQARPQSGLEVADIVYEEVVEGGVTRFLTIFHTELPEVAGPIRSARPVDTQLMGGYGRSGFAYSGAREEVREMLAETPSIRITEGGPGFFRDDARVAPHNLYVDTTETHADLLDREPDPVGDVGWVFDERPPPGAVSCPTDETGDVDAADAVDAASTGADAGAAAPQDGAGADTGVQGTAAGAGDPAPTGCEDPGGSVSVAMSQFFTTGWEYDPDAGLYRRFQDGEPFTVTGEEVIGAANVVVLATRHYVGASGYPETDVVTDEAPAVILRDGARYDATWTKPTAGDLLELHAGDGEPFPLKPGPTWVLLPDADDLPTLAD